MRFCCNQPPIWPVCRLVGRLIVSAACMCVCLPACLHAYFLHACSVVPHHACMNLHIGYVCFMHYMVYTVYIAYKSSHTTLRIMVKSHMHTAHLLLAYLALPGCATPLSVCFIPYGTHYIYYVLYVWCRKP